MAKDENLYQEARPLTNVQRPKQERSVWRHCTFRSIWRLLVEIALVSVSTALVVVMSQNDFKANRALIWSLETMLTPVSLRGPKGSVNYLPTPMVVRQSAAIQIIRDFHKVYYELGSNSVDFFEHHTDSSGKIQPLLLSVSRFKDPSKPAVTTQKVFLLPPNATSPEPAYESPGFLEKLSSMMMSFSVFHCQLLYRRICKNWTVNFSLNMRYSRHTDDEGLSSRGNFDISYKFDDDEIPGLHRTIVLRLGFTLLVIACISLLTLILPFLVEAIKAFRNCCCNSQNDMLDEPHFESPLDRSQKNLGKLRHKRVKLESRGQKITSFSRYGSFVCSSCPPSSSTMSRWTWAAIGVSRDVFFITSVCAILERRTHIFDPTFHAQNRILLLATGVFLGWLSLLPHIKILGPDYFATLRTLQKVFPFVSKFVLGCAPLFIGYVLLGIAILAIYTPKFRGVGQSLVTLWSVMNGDQLFDNFQDAAQFTPILSRFFFYTFMLLFITIISKLALSSVEYIFFKQMPNPSCPNSFSKSDIAANNSLLRRKLLPPRYTDDCLSPLTQKKILKDFVQCSDRLFERFLGAVRSFELSQPRFEFLTAGASLQHFSRIHSLAKVGDHIPELMLACESSKSCAVCQLIVTYRDRHSIFRQCVFSKVRGIVKRLSVKGSGKLDFRSKRG